MWYQQLILLIVLVQQYRTLQHNTQFYDTWRGHKLTLSGFRASLRAPGSAACFPMFCDLLAHPCWYNYFPTQVVTPWLVILLYSYGMHMVLLLLTNKSGGQLFRRVEQQPLLFPKTACAAFTLLLYLLLTSITIEPTYPHTVPVQGCIDTAVLLEASSSEGSPSEYRTTMDIILLPFSFA